MSSDSLTPTPFSKDAATSCCVTLVSFPKSGRTWLRHMLNHMGTDFTISHAGSAHLGRLPFEELRPRLAELRDRRILFMLRDPRDTAVSGFFQATRRKPLFEGDMTAFLRDPRHGLEKIIRFNLLWTGAAQEFQDFAQIHYEDLHRAPLGELARVVRFVSGRHPDFEETRKAAGEGSFANMRRLEESGEGTRLYGSDLTPRDPQDAESYKVRRGVVAGWREYLTPADEAFAESLFDKYQYGHLLRSDKGA